MTFIQLLLSFARQSIGCEANLPQRNLTFLGKPHGNNLAVTRDGQDFDAGQSQWIVQVFDSQEQPLTEFYVERAAERNIKCLAGAIYLPPEEYEREAQPEIQVYVWLPSLAFNAIWEISSSLETRFLQATINLSVPFRGSALDYLHGGPEDYDKVWHAERENPLLMQSTEFNIYPIKRKNEGTA